MQRQYLRPSHPCVNADGQNIVYVSATSCQIQHEFFFFLLRQVTGYLIVPGKKLNLFTRIILTFSSFYSQIKDVGK